MAHGLSIAEAVGDPRVRKLECHLCKQKFFLRLARGARRKICPNCQHAWAALRNKAQQKVYKAIRHGVIQPARKQLCVDCGKPATCLDHRSYSKPLDVVPTCNSCNSKRGSASP